MILMWLLSNTATCFLQTCFRDEAERSTEVASGHTNTVMVTVDFCCYEAVGKHNWAWCKDGVTAVPTCSIIQRDIEGCYES